MGLILVILLVLLFIGGLPAVSGHGYGYAPSGLVFVLLIVFVVLLVGGRL